MPSKKKKAGSKKKPAKETKEADDGWDEIQGLLTELTTESQAAKAKLEAAAKAAHAFICEGQKFLKVEQWGAAEQLFRQAVLAQPESSKAHFQLGSALFMGGDHKQATGELAHAFDYSVKGQEAPTQYEICLNLGSAAVMNPATLEVGITAFEKALLLKPRHVAKDFLEGQIEQAKEALRTKDDITLKVPDGAVAGDTITITIDGNKHKYTLPPDFVKGGTITLQKRKEKYFVDKETGRDLVVAVPKGAKPGDTLRVQEGSAAGTDVVIPKGAKPGDEIPVKTLLLPEEEDNAAVMDDLRKKAKDRLSGKSEAVPGMEWLDKALADGNYVGAPEDNKDGKKEASESAEKAGK